MTKQSGVLKLKSLLIEKPNKFSLIIRKYRLESLFSIVRSCFYFLFFYGIGFYFILPISSIHSIQDFLEKIQQFLDKDPNLLEDSWLVLFFIFLVLPIFDLPNFFREIWTLFHADTFYFDSLSKQITINNKIQINFNEIDSLNIRRFPRSSNLNEYRLLMITRDGEKIKIEQSSNFEDICDAADEIADLIGLSIVGSDY